MMVKQFGKYELLRRIGVGGMGEVYVARARGAEGFVKEVVIKRILPALTQDAELVAMFIREAQLAAVLRHANIVQILDFDQVEGEYYIAMEWVDGPDLRQVQAASRRRGLAVPERLAVHVGVEALKGLHFAHTRIEAGRALGVVHRDISPHNLLVSFAGEVKIADFGVAKVAALASSLQGAGLKGKLTYMSPEQLQGRSVDRRSDLYALGVVLWELLSARRAYDERASEGELIAAVQAGRIQPLDELRPDLPAPLRAAVGKLLSRELDARYQSAAEALADLNEVAGVGDAIAVSEFLHRLMPEEAERDHRGQTEAVGMALSPLPRRAGPDEPTASRPRVLSGGAESSEGEQAYASGGGGETSSTSAAASAASSRPPRRWSERSSWRVAVMLIVFSGSCGLVWWSRRTVQDAGPEWKGDSRLSSAGLVIRNSAAPAELFVEGVPLGRPADVELRSLVGTSLLVRASRSGATRERLVKLSHGSHPVELSVDALFLDRAARDASAARGASGRAEGQASEEPREGMEATSGESVASGTPAVDVPARLTAPRRAPTRRRPRGVGRLSVFVSPWASVSVDDRAVGSTPIVEHPLPAGRHTIALANEELSQQETLRVTVVAGQTLKLRRDWLAPRPRATHATE